MIEVSFALLWAYGSIKCVRHGHDALGALCAVCSAVSLLALIMARLKEMHP